MTDAGTPPAPAAPRGPDRLYSSPATPPAAALRCTGRDGCGVLVDDLSEHEAWHSRLDAALLASEADQ